MTNADKFKGIFGIYATELWAKPEKEFLEWLNKEVPDTNDGDFISRKAAIDAINQYRQIVDGLYIGLTDTDSVLSKIRGLPSAQPEIRVKMVDDTISRQAAIRATCEKSCQSLEPCGAECSEVIALKELPPAQRKGKWVTGGYDTAGNMKVMTVKCSACGNEATSLISTDGMLWNIEMIYNYCPNCGADMRGDI